MTTALAAAQVVFAVLASVFFLYSVYTAIVHKQLTDARGQLEALKQEASTIAASLSRAQGEAETIHQRVLHEACFFREDVLHYIKDLYSLLLGVTQNLTDDQAGGEGHAGKLHEALVTSLRGYWLRAERQLREYSLMHGDKASAYNAARWYHENAQEEDATILEQALAKWRAEDWTIAEVLASTRYPRRTQPSSDNQEKVE